MARERESKIPANHYRSVAFPLDAPGDIHPAERERRWRRYERLAKIFKTTAEAIEAEGLADDIPDWGSEAPKGKKDMANEEDFEVVSSGWDEVDRTLGSGGEWLKVNDGQVVELNVVGEPKHIRKAFRDEKPKDRVLYRVFVPGMGVKSWEVAGATHAEIKEERKACKEPFGDALIAVKRNGSGPDTRYRIRYRRQLTAQEIAARSDSGAAQGVDAGEPF